MHRLAGELWPICRSITGDGVRNTLAILSRDLPDLVIHEVPSGTTCLDWTVPPEWNIRSATLTGPSGEKIADFADNNLHIVGYSIPVDRELDLDELQAHHLHSLPDQPDAIPYVTSYYRPTWGFCLPDNQRRQLTPGRYRAQIDSTLADGHLTYGELVIPGDSGQEIFISTYICHPSMANNELSGPVVSHALARWIAALPRRRFTYRVVFIPETIGSIVYISRNLERLRTNVVAAFNVTCIGDERSYSFLPSRYGNTIADRVARHVLTHAAPGYFEYDFIQRGSDERQYCAPGVDLPMVSVMRSKYGEYPEYHTSLDNLDFVTPAGLAGGFAALCRCIGVIEADRIYRTTVLGEPQMGPRGLYSSIGGRAPDLVAQTRIDILMYADGTNTLLEIANLLQQPLWELTPLLVDLIDHGLVEELAEKERFK